MSTFSIYATVANVPVSRQFATRQNVRKDIHFLRYQGSIEPEDTVCGYVGSTEINPVTNLNVVDLSNTVQENSSRAFSGEVQWTGLHANTVTKQILLTNVWGDFAHDVPTPFYWKHVLPNPSIHPDSVVIVDQDLVEVQKYSYQAIRTPDYDLDTGAIIENEYDDCSVFSNYKNTYDPETGEAVLYYVRYEIEGSSHYDLLNSVPAFSEATYEDVWMVVGTLKPWRRVYILSPGTFHYKVTVPTASATYSMKSLGSGRIQAIEPTIESDEQPWFLSITNGSFARFSDDIQYSYSIPEYSSQDFNPLYPYKIMVEEKAIRVRGNILLVAKVPIQAATTFYTLDIVIKDRFGTVLYALTTETSKDGTYYEEQGERVFRTFSTENEWVTWDTDGIVGWDRYGGFIHLAKEYPDIYTFHVTYYYKEEEYELTTLNLNPIFDETYRKGQFYVVYIVPVGGNNNNAGGTQTSSIHYLKINNSGKVIAASQTPSSGNYGVSANISIDGEYLTYQGVANTTTLTSFGNGDTTITVSSIGITDFPTTGAVLVGNWSNDPGLAKYTSITQISPTIYRFNLSAPFAKIAEYPIGQEVKFFSFENIFSSSQDNNMQWHVIAEVHPSHTKRPDELSIIDCRQRGGVLKESYYYDATKIDPRAVWARPQLERGRGQPIPGETASIIKIPYSILTDYGGSFSPEAVETIVKRHLALGVVPIITYHGAIPEITSGISTSTTITICWDSEGTNYSYNIYYSMMEGGPWMLVNGTPLVDVGYGNCYTLTALDPNKIYYVTVASVDSEGNVGPTGVVWGLKTKTS